MRTALLILAFAGLVYGEVTPSVTAPARVTIEVNRLGTVNVTYKGSDFKYLADQGIDVFREYDPDSSVIRLRVQGNAPGTFRIVYIAASAEGKLSEWATTAIVVGGGNPVPPGPGPGPGPTPPPDPLPAITSAYVLVIEETAEAAAGRGTFFTDQDVAAWFRANPNWKPRAVDKDIKDPATGKTPAGFQPWLDKVKGKTLPQILVIDQDGNVRYQGDMPKTPADLLALLKGIK